MFSVYRNIYYLYNCTELNTDDDDDDDDENDDDGQAG